MTAPAFWPGKKVFVTGATGLIGSWLVKNLLSAGASVTALILDREPQSELIRSGDLRKLTAVDGRLEDFDVVQRGIVGNGCDTIFHLGAQTIVGTAHRAPMETFESNIRGTYHVLEVARRHPEMVRRVLVASSDKAYGEQEQLPYTEDQALNGRHPYEVSKSCADLIAQGYYHTYRTPVAVARCGNVYGGGDLNWSRIVPDTIRACLGGKAPVIRSDGTYIRDYIYVKDVVRAYLVMAEQLENPAVKGGAFNFSNETPISVLNLVREIQAALQCSSLKPEIRNDAPGEIRNQHLSSARARSILGWKPTYDLKSGLRETIAWYRDFLSDS